MAEYMLFIRDVREALSDPAEAESRVQEYIAWSKQLRDSGHSLDGNEIAPDGVVIGANDAGELERRATERLSPIGGYFHIRADSEEQAIEIAANAPAIRHGGAVEVRALIDHS